MPFPVLGMGNVTRQANLRATQVTLSTVRKWWASQVCRGTLVSQLNAPASLRFLREQLVRWAIPRDISWFDVGLKTGLVGLYTLILYLAIHTGALFDNFDQLYSNPISAALFIGGAGFFFFILLFTL